MRRDLCRPVRARSFFTRSQGVALGWLVGAPLVLDRADALKLRRFASAEFGEARAGGEFALALDGAAVGALLAAVGEAAFACGFGFDGLPEHRGSSHIGGG